MRTPWIRGLLRRLLFLGVFFLLLAGMVEAGARARWSLDDTVMAESSKIYQDHPLLFWTLRPSAHLRDRMLEMVTNSWGMRSPELDVPKRRIRVLLLGESSTMGAGVAQWDTYASRLQGRLNQQAPDRYEVVNAGTGAWTVWQSWVLLKHYGEKLSPDVVIAYHQHNDFLPRGVLDSHNYLYAVSSTDRALYERRAPVAPFLGVLLQSRAYLRLRKEILLQSPGKVLDQSSTTGGVRVPEADRKIAWEGLIAWCEAHKVPLIAVKPLYQRSFDQEDRLLPSIISAHHLPTLDVPTFAAQRGYNQGNFLIDGVHPNPTGHALIAEGLSPLVLAAAP